MLRPGLLGASLLIALSAGAAQADSIARSGSKSVGNERFGARLSRTMVARHAGAGGALDCRTTVGARVLGRTLRVASLARRVEVRGLGGGPVTTQAFHVELLGGGRFRVGPRFQRAMEVARFEVPVPIGPFPVKLRGAVGSYIELRATVGLSGGNVQVGLEGSCAVGGRVGIGVGVPGATVGVEGHISLLKSALPATATLRRTGVTVDVAYVVSSEVDISLFAEVGFGPFKKTWRVKVPFLTFTFNARRFPLATLTVRG